MMKDDKIRDLILGFILTLAFELFAFGCSTGVTIALKDNSGVNVGSISFQETQWPIVSYFTGPTFRFWARQDFDGTIWADGYANMTNTTSALGIYNSSEQKALKLTMAYNAPTNKPVMLVSMPEVDK